MSVSDKAAFFEEMLVLAVKFGATDRLADYQNVPVETRSNPRPPRWTLCAPVIVGHVADHPKGTAKGIGPTVFVDRPGQP